MKYNYIENQEQYEEVTLRVEQFKDAEPGTNEAKELKVLVKMLVNFEKKQVQDHNKIKR
ncbi:hypothetical protein [Pontibacter diazotrophicus]|nr:hypothetical protein [Pontibacter diazotrophicus]